MQKKFFHLAPRSKLRLVSAARQFRHLKYLETFINRQWCHQFTLNSLRLAAKFSNFLAFLAGVSAPPDFFISFEKKIFFCFFFWQSSKLLRALCSDLSAHEPNLSITIHFITGLCMHLMHWFALRCARTMKIFNFFFWIRSRSAFNVWTPFWLLFYYFKLFSCSLVLFFRLLAKNAREKFDGVGAREFFIVFFFYVLIQQKLWIFLVQFVLSETELN